MNAQQIFNTVAAHLFAQGRPAVKKDGHHFACQYRADNGMKCAVGVLIPDDHYLSEMEGRPVEDLIDRYSSLPAFMARHEELLSALQGVHDHPVDGPLPEVPLTKPPAYDKTTLKSRLSQVADEFELDSSVLDTLRLGEADAVS